MVRISTTVALASLAALLSFAGAADGQAPKRQPFSLTVSPARIVVSAKRMRSTRFFEVSNGGRRALRLELSVKEFSQAPNGQILFSRGGPLSAASWVSAAPMSFRLGPGDRRRVRVRTAIPRRPEPGERQVAVIFKVPAPRRGRNIAISGAIGAQLLINVPGPVVRRSAIGPLDLPRFADGGPVPVKLRVRNLGNVHRDYFRPDGNLVADASGRTLAFPDFSVLRGSSRVVEAEWRNPPRVCICKVSVESDDGRGRPVTASARVVVFPFRMAVGSLIAAAGLLLLLRGVIRRTRARTEARIEQAREEALEAARREREASSEEALR